MAQGLLNLFDDRQGMQRSDFEVFRFNDPAACATPPHRHDFLELYFPVSEDMDYIVDGLRYRLAPGSAVLIRPRQIHRGDVPGPARDIERFVLWLSVDFVLELTEGLPRVRRALLGGGEGPSLIQPDPDTAALTRRLLGDLHREAASDTPESARLCRCALTQLLIHSARCLENPPKEPAPRSELRYREIMQVYEHILTHLPDELSVAGLAEQFFMDKNTLTRQFKRQVGMTPGECIRRHRLEAARRLILEGTPTQEACARCGFSDYSAFYRAFRQVYGLSPRDCAARRRANPEPPLREG